MNAAQFLELAIAHHQAGRLAEAEAICRQILTAHPRLAAVLYRLGLIALTGGRLAEAADWLSRAIAESPTQAEFHADLGVVNWQLARQEEAVACFRRALALRPDMAQVHTNLGNALTDLGNDAGAIASYQRAIELQPDFAVAYNNLANVLSRQGRMEEAATLYRRAIALQPDFIEALCNLGNNLTLQGRGDEAIPFLRRVVELRPDFAEGHNLLGAALWKARGGPEAIASLRRAIELDPRNTDALNNLGAITTELEGWDEAVALFQRVLTQNPNHSVARGNLGCALTELGRMEEAIAEFHYLLAQKAGSEQALWDLGVAYGRAMKFDDAIRCYRQAIALRAGFADAHLNLALILLLIGQFEEGWREYEWRWLHKGHGSPRRDFAAPQWDGAPLPGRTLLLHAEQGFGDAIQFLRYVPLALDRSQAARVIVECPPELSRLFTQVAGPGVEVVTFHDWEGTALPPFDAHLPMLSLPFALGTFQPLSISSPSLHADDALRAQWRERLRPGVRVGLAWTGRSTHNADRYRSIPFEKLRPLFGVPGVSFYNVQPMPEALADSSLVDVTAHLTDFADTAALMMELDLIITVDTAAAHLAGALGRPVWLLLPIIPDWRWGLGRDDTPWYPTMRLLRQRTTGDWDEVMQRVAAELGTNAPAS